MFIEPLEARLADEAGNRVIGQVVVDLRSGFKRRVDRSDPSHFQLPLFCASTSRGLLRVAGRAHFPQRRGCTAANPSVTISQPQMGQAVRDRAAAGLVVLFFLH